MKYFFLGFIVSDFFSPRVSVLGHCPYSVTFPYILYIRYICLNKHICVHMFRCVPI